MYNVEAGVYHKTGSFVKTMVAYDIGFRASR